MRYNVYEVIIICLLVMLFVYMMAKLVEIIKCDRRVSKLKHDGGDEYEIYYEETKLINLRDVFILHVITYIITIVVVVWCNFGINLFSNGQTILQKGIEEISSQIR